jgi:predicted Ser/Thr protein kinase
LFKEEHRVCANELCKKHFAAKVYNAIYCGTDCRRIVTNKKLLEKYYELKENKNKKRICKSKDCLTVLSRYNKEIICEQCKNERFIKRLVSWGYDEEKLRKEV